MANIANSAQVKIGWYRIEEDWKLDGNIDISIKDPRTNELVSFTLECLEDYDQLIRFLDENRPVGALSLLKES